MHLREIQTRHAGKNKVKLDSRRQQAHSTDENGDTDCESAAYQYALELCAIDTWSKVRHYGHFKINT